MSNSQLSAIMSPLFATTLLLLAIHTQAVPLPDADPREAVSQPKNGAPSGKFYLAAEPLQWHMCGDASDPFQITDVTVNPWPIKFSETVGLPLNIAIKGNLSKAVTGGHMQLEVKKKLPYVEVWEKVPCIDKYGSCLYDLCMALIHIFEGACDPWFQQNNIPCHCPMQPQEMNVPLSTLHLPAVGGIPSWLADGDFQVQLTFTDENKGPIGCFWIQLSIFEGK